MELHLNKAGCGGRKLHHKTLRKTPPSWSTASGQHCSDFCCEDLSSSQQSVSLRRGRGLFPLHLSATKEYSKDSPAASVIWVSSVLHTCPME